MRSRTFVNYCRSSSSAVREVALRVQNHPAISYISVEKLVAACVVKQKAILASHNLRLSREVKQVCHIRAMEHVLVILDLIERRIK